MSSKPLRITSDESSVRLAYYLSDDNESGSLTGELRASDRYMGVHRAREQTFALAEDLRQLMVPLPHRVLIPLTAPGYCGELLPCNASFEKKTDNFAFNGGLMLMPGAHRVFVPCVGQTPDDNFRQSLKKQKIGVPSDDAITELGLEYGIEQFTGPAGHALFFDSNSMHASSNNITPYSRANVFLVFNSVENAPAAPYGATAPRPPHIADRDITPLTPIHNSEFV